MLRSEQNPEEQGVLHEGPTSYKTRGNHFRIRCGMCGDLYFVDEATFEGISTAIQAGLDNPFLCTDCQEEYDELAYEG